jgi:hypothetical protein
MRSGEPGADGGGEGEAEEPGQESDDAEGNGVNAEEGRTGEEEEALTEDSDGALRVGLEESAKEAAQAVDLLAETEPGEVVIGEPGEEGVPEEGKAEDGCDQEGRLRRFGTRIHKKI